MPDQPTHQTTHQATKRFTEERADHPGQTGQSSGAGRPGVTVGELIRPARPAMIVTGLLTAVGALMSIVPFEALRNMAAIWLGESSPPPRAGAAVCGSGRPSPSGRSSPPRPSTWRAWGSRT